MLASTATADKLLTTKLRLFGLGTMAHRPLSGRPSSLPDRADSDLPELVDAAAWFRLPPVGGVIAPAVRPASVGVSDAVGVGELASADDRACPSLGVCVTGECSNASRDIGRRLGDAEAGTVAARVPPVRLGDTEVLQHLLRAQPAGRHADGRHGTVLELGAQA